MIADIDKRNIDTVHHFWFGEIVDGLAADEKGKLWFGGGPKTDNLIATEFEPLVIAADTGELDAWKNEPKGTMAMIILLDQFPLNIYRKTSRAFAFGHKAVDACKHGLQLQQDQTLSVVERMFFYLPLEHSENLEDQSLSVSLFRSLNEQASESQKKFTQAALRYANDHFGVIKKFGRYPYRNEVLGRASTDLENQWLDDMPQRYGQ